jgi:hypothetical protein
MQPYDPFSRLDKSAFVVRTTFEDLDEVAFWRSQPEVTRLRHIERLRRINYGRRASFRLQRILETARR